MDIEEKEGISQQSEENKSSQHAENEDNETSHSNESNQMEEDNPNNEDKLNEYIQSKFTHLSCPFTPTEQLLSSLPQDELSLLLQKVEESELIKLIEKDMELTIENYNKEMDFFSSLFSYYNKYLSWIYLHQQNQ